MEHLATGTEAVNRRMARRVADRYCSPGPPPTARHPLCAGRMARHHHTAAARLLAERARALPAAPPPPPAVELPACRLPPMRMRA
eukprot:3252745-Prymnesium_polylepis.1